MYQLIAIILHFLYKPTPQQTIAQQRLALLDQPNYSAMRARAEAWDKIWAGHDR